RGHESRRQSFTERNDGVLAARRKLAKRGDRAHKIFQLGHESFRRGFDFIDQACIGERVEQLSSDSQVPFKKRVDAGGCFFKSALPRRVRDLEQRVGGSRHRRYNHNRRAVQAPLNNGGHSIDGGGIFNGGAAEFHYNHFSFQREINVS